MPSCLEVCQRTRRPARLHAEILPLPDTAFRSRLYFLVKNLICLADWPGLGRSYSAHSSQTALAQRLGISQSRISAMELDPGSIRAGQLFTLLAALNHEMLIQPKLRVGCDTAAKPEW